MAEALLALLDQDDSPGGDRPGIVVSNANDLPERVAATTAEQLRRRSLAVVEPAVGDRPARVTLTHAGERMARRVRAHRRNDG